MSRPAMSPVALTRMPLPARRPSLTFAADWQGHALAVTVGFDPDTARAREVFANTANGGAMQASLADACVIISVALQHGIAPQALAKSLGHVPDLLRGAGACAPASPVGTVIAVLLGAQTLEVQSAGGPA